MNIHKIWHPLQEVPTFSLLVLAGTQGRVDGGRLEQGTPGPVCWFLLPDP